MNHLAVGFKREIELPAKGGFLYISDEVPSLPRWRRARIFDPTKHSINPLKHIDHRRARELAEVLYALDPDVGTTTLTVRYGKRALRQILEANRDKTLDTLSIPLDRAAVGSIDAIGLIADIIASPVLQRVLCRPGKDFSFTAHSVVLARINRAELGAFEARVLYLVLMSMFEGQLVIPHLGVAARDIHETLVLQNRLIAGVDYLDQLPPRLKSALLLMSVKRGRGALHHDAELLARYEGLRPDPVRLDNPYNRYVNEAMT